MNLSITEGIPVSIMEAQSVGIPALVTKVGGTSEIVNKENGFLVDKNFDVRDVVSIIKNYFEGDKKKYQNKRNLSYTNWEKKYSAKNYMKFVNLLNLN
jgi:glycosyltransferase involved in cell wall biosynthesis